MGLFDILRQFTGGEEVENYSPYIEHLREKEGVSYTPYRPTTKENEPNIGTLSSSGRLSKFGILALTAGNLSSISSIN